MNSKVKKIYKNNFYLINIILLGLILRLYAFLNNGIVFWDGAVYIGMGKYFFSNEAIGLYEVFRPPVFALILGFFWFTGLNPITSGQLFIMIISLISIFLTYKITIQLFDKKIALLASFFLSITATHVYYSSKVLNDNLSLFFVLLTILLLTYKNKKYFLIGIIVGINFLTRFQTLSILPLIIGYIFCIWYYNNKDWITEHLINKKIKNTFCNKNLIILVKDNIKLLSGFIIIIIPYLYYNYIKFNNAILFFTEGSKIIKLVGKSISENILYYPVNLFYENIFIIFIFFGFYLFIKKTKKIYLKKDIKAIKNCAILWLITFFTLINFLYLSYLARKEMRYMVIILPFLYMFVSYAIIEIIKRRKEKARKIILFIIVFFISILSLSINNNIYQDTFKIDINQEIIDNYLLSPINGGHIATSSPILIAYKDFKPTVIYWTREGMYEYYEKLNITTYFINTCELFCVQNDINCNKGKKDFISNLKSNYDSKFYKKENQCEYYVFTK